MGVESCKCLQSKIQNPTSEWELVRQKEWQAGTSLMGQ
jgi:hypothetical protein